MSLPASAFDAIAYSQATPLPAAEAGVPGAAPAPGSDGGDVTASTAAASAPGRARTRLVLKGKGDGVCHVCGLPGHTAGFDGAVYVDCPNYNCYLCKQAGHTTMTCPFNPQNSRGNPGSSEAGSTTTRPLGSSLVSTLRQRQTRQAAARERERLYTVTSPGRWHEVGRGRSSPAPWTPYQSQLPWRVGCGVVKLHTRRCTTLQFHPTLTHLLVSTDKSGELAVWNYATQATIPPTPPPSNLPGGHGDGATCARSAHVNGRFVYSAHKWLIHALDWGVPGRDDLQHTAYTASADGTVRQQRLDGRGWEELVDVNLGGWTGDEAAWRMFYSLSTGHGVAAGYHGPMLAGDDMGRLWALDARAPRPVVACVQAHRRGGKIQCIHHNPGEGMMVATTSNDWTVRLWDIRLLSRSAGWSREGLATFSERGGRSAVTSAAGGGRHTSTQGGTPLTTLPHPRVVTAAYFSPHTGHRLLTTCIDNRLRVWNDVVETVTRAGDDGSCPPSLEVVHSHDFARYLTPFRAVWDVKDGHERTVVCGRYISEAFDTKAITQAAQESVTARAGPPPAPATTTTTAPNHVALHPIDVLDVLSPRPWYRGGGGAGTGLDGWGQSWHAVHPSHIVAQLVDPVVTTISPVVAVHPTHHIIATGSSRNVHVWVPAPAMAHLHPPPSNTISLHDDDGDDRFTLSLDNAVLRRGLTRVDTVACMRGHGDQVGMEWRCGGTELQPPRLVSGADASMDGVVGEAGDDDSSGDDSDGHMVGGGRVASASGTARSRRSNKSKEGGGGATKLARKKAMAKASGGSGGGVMPAAAPPPPRLTPHSPLQSTAIAAPTAAAVAVTGGHRAALLPARVSVTSSPSGRHGTTTTTLPPMTSPTVGHRLLSPYFPSPRHSGGAAGGEVVHVVDDSEGEGDGVVGSSQEDDCWVQAGAWLEAGVPPTQPAPTVSGTHTSSAATATTPATTSNPFGGDEDEGDTHADMQQEGRPW